MIILGTFWVLLRGRGPQGATLGDQGGVLEDFGHHLGRGVIGPPFGTFGTSVGLPLGTSGRHRGFLWAKSGLSSGQMERNVEFSESSVFFREIALSVGLGTQVACQVAFLGPGEDCQVACQGPSVLPRGLSKPRWLVRGLVKAQVACQMVGRGPNVAWSVHFNVLGAEPPQRRNCKIHNNIYIYIYIYMYTRSA